MVVVARRPFVCVFFYVVTLRCCTNCYKRKYYNLNKLPVTFRIRRPHLPFLYYLPLYVWRAHIRVRKIHSTLLVYRQIISLLDAISKIRVQVFWITQHTVQV